MTDRALSENAMLASLHDIRLPTEAAGGLVADVAMTIGLAGVAALLVAAGLRLVSQRIGANGPPSLQDRLAGIQHLPEEHRRLALLHLLRQRAPERYAQIAQELYRPKAGVTAQAVQAELDRLV